MSTDRANVLVVGGGIAGVGAASFLAARADVTLVEREPTLAYHTTGRSAALFFENYGAGPIRPLTRASRAYLENSSADAVDLPLLSRRGALTIADERGLQRLEEVAEEGTAGGTVVERIDTSGAMGLCPVLRPEAVAAAIWEPEAADIDVATLHQSFVRRLRTSGGAIRVGGELQTASHDGSHWTAHVGDAVWEGDVIVNAAGAWGDIIAERCGVSPIGLTPMRRTAFMVAGHEAWKQWPLVVEVDHRFYFKPDGVQLLCSLAEENPCEPCDARPEEVDVARAIERINAATTLDIRHVRSAWTGLRTFASDRAMVIGPDPDQAAFVWLVGQGGTGIQTAPAASRLAAALALGDPVPEDIAEAGLDPDSLSARRFRTAAGARGGEPDVRTATT